MLRVGRALAALGLHIRSTLLGGMLVVIPLAVTFLILRFVFDFFDPLLKPVFEQAVNRYTPGMGIASLVVIIYLVGLVTTHVLGRRMIGLAHSMVDLIPVVRTVYRTARQATEVFSFSTVGPGGKFSSVVLVEFPGRGLKSIGLVTSRIKDQEGKPLLAVYMPTSPFPTSGFLVFLHENQVTPTDLPVEDAMKLIVSAGIIAPKNINSYPNPFGDATGAGAEQTPHISDNRASNQ